MKASFSYGFISAEKEIEGEKERDREFAMF